MAGYHLYDIPKGVLGEYSKVIEEFEEFQDALEQDAAIMAIIELSDLVGAAKYYYFEQGEKARWQEVIAHIYTRDGVKALPVDSTDLFEAFRLTLDMKKINHWDKLDLFLYEVDGYVRAYNLTIRDLIRMSSITERAFISGRRT